MDTNTRTQVWKMLNGDGNHYDVADKLRKDNTRYFSVRGSADLLKTFKTLVTNATDYEVVEVEERGDRFKAEIELED